MMTGDANRGFHRRAVLAAGLGLPLLRTAAIAAPAAPVTLSPQDNADLQRVAAYLNGIHTMTARFRQVDSRGGVSAGWMWIQRPGRMRFEYDAPNPITLIADTFYVYYWDKQLQEMQKIGLKATAAWFLLRDPITFGPDILVTSFDHGGNQIRIGVAERAQPDLGSLTMNFSENPISLRQWTVIDQQGKSTSVSLSNQQFGMALDPKLFQYEEPYEAARREFQKQ